MGFFSKRKAAAEAATSDVEAWMRTADEASEHDALDMVDVDAALGGVTPAPPAPPTLPASPELTNFDPATVADQYRRAEDDASMWHFPELEDEIDPATTAPATERRAPQAETPEDDVTPGPSMFDMLSNSQPRAEVEGQALLEGWSTDEGPLGDVTLTAGGKIDDAWATFDSLSPAPESDALDGLWGSKKDRRKPTEAAATDDTEQGTAGADPFAPIDHLLPESTETSEGDSPEAAAWEQAAWQVPGLPADDSTIAFDDTGAPEASLPLDDEAASFDDTVSFDAASFDDVISFDDLVPADDGVPDEDEIIDLDPVYGPLPVPDTDQTRQLLDILGLEPGTDWAKVRRIRADLIAAHDPSEEADAERLELAAEIRGEINSAYAALRLLFVA